MLNAYQQRNESLLATKDFSKSNTSLSQDCVSSRVHQSWFTAPIWELLFYDPLTNPQMHKARRGVAKIRPHLKWEREREALKQANVCRNNIGERKSISFYLLRAFNNDDKVAEWLWREFTPLTQIANSFSFVLNPSQHGLCETVSVMILRERTA